MKSRMTIAGRKIWVDNDDMGKTRPPSVEINLIRDEEVYKTVIVSAKDNWSYEFKSVPVQKNSRHIYSYRIEEPLLPKGYISETDGYDLINTLSVMTITGTKTWVDNNNLFGERPTEITVNLLQNGRPFRTIVAESPPDVKDKAEFSFADVPVFDDDGNLFVYTVDENNVDNYFKIVNGFDIMNTSLRLIFSVTYNANGGTGSFSEHNIFYGTQYMVKTPECAGIHPVNGYGFAGFNTASDGSKTAYPPGDVITVTENMVLYAQWVSLKSEPPFIEQIVALDEVVTGKGIPESDIVVAFPDGRISTTVAGDGTWIVNIPNGVVLTAGNVVSAVQTEPGKTAGDAVRMAVEENTEIEPDIKINAVNLTTGRNFAQAGDLLQYNVLISNNGTPSSNWKSPYVTFFLDGSVSLQMVSIRINNMAAASSQYSYNSSENSLILYLNDIAGGNSFSITFRVVVKDGISNVEEIVLNAELGSL